jgi:hypothetical protein
VAERPPTPSGVPDPQDRNVPRPLPPVSRPSRLLAVVGLLIALLVGASGGPAGGQAAPDAGDDQLVVQSWALAPTGSDPAEPSSRPALTYTAEPGATIQDSVTLWNYGNVQLTFRVYPTDAYNNAQGAFDILPGDQDPKDVGTWITVPQAFVTVPAFSKVDLPITVTVPSGATPGDHAGAILASNQAEGTGPDGRTVAVDRRTGSRVYLRVGGDLTSQLTITKARSVYHGGLNPLDGSLDVTYTVRNVGNVRLGATQQLTLENLFGRKGERANPKPIEELLPGNEVVVHHHFEGVAATLRAGAEIVVTPAAPGGGAAADIAEAKATSRTASTWAMPWLLLGLALVLVLLQRGLRRRRTRQVPDGPASADVEPHALVHS